MCPTSEQAVASVAQSATRPLANPSSACAVIAATANARAAPRTPRRRFPSAGFRILQGTPKRYVTKADSGDDVLRVFCGNCGTPLYVQVGTRPDLVGLRVCTLDDPSWFKPDADIFMRSAQPWDHDQSDVPKHDAYPPGHSYPTAPRLGE